MASAQTFQLADTAVEPGTSAHVSLPVPAGSDDPATTIPITVINGLAPGPVLLIVAGVHGYEFAPILAASTFAGEIEPSHLTGTLLIVHTAHTSAFEQRTPYVNPYDRKNLNRSFPGRAEGTQTERIAHALSTELISRADVVLDVHSGDGAEWLEAFTGVYGGPLATDYETALAIGKAFGFPNVVRYRMETQAQIDRGRSLNRQAVAAGAPTVLVEIGQNGSRDPVQVRSIVDGLHRVLAVLNMASTDLPASATEPRYFDGTFSVPVNHTGIWSPSATGGRVILKGETLGVIHDYWGAPLQEVTAPEAGYAIYGLAGPPVRAGESVMTIARPVESLEPTQ